MKTVFISIGTTLATLFALAHPWISIPFIWLALGFLAISLGNYADKRIGPNEPLNFADDPKAYITFIFLGPISTIFCLGFVLVALKIEFFAKYKLQPPIVKNEE